LILLGSELFDIAGALLAVTLSGESFLCAAFFARLQVKRVPLDFLNNIFLLNLPFEAAQRTLKRFTVLQMDFCQLISPPSANALQLNTGIGLNTFIVT